MWWLLVLRCGTYVDRWLVLCMVALWFEMWRLTGLICGDTLAGELVTPKIFEESFSDISTAMSSDGGETMFNDPSKTSLSPSSIADLMRNFEVSFPGPSRGDRGSLMICCVCRRVYPEDHRVTCRWCGKHVYASIDVQAPMQDITARNILTADQLNDVVLWEVTFSL